MQWLWKGLHSEVSSEYASQYSYMKVTLFLKNEKALSQKSGLRVYYETYPRQTLYEHTAW